MDDLVYWPLLMRYLAGECTLAERAQVDAWIVREPERRAYVDSLRQLGAATSAAASASAREVDPVVALERVRAQLSHLGRPLAPSSSPAVATTRSTVPSPNPWRRVPGGAGGGAGTRWARRLSIAAAAALVVGGVEGVRALGGHQNQQVFRELTTQPASRATVLLRDGTRLVLGPATRVRVPADFGRVTRTVELTGEAFFAVTHDAQHPFSVQIAGAVVTDVGTEFDVRAYAGEPVARVAVADGRVSLVRTDRAPAAASAHALVVGDIALVSDTGIAVAHDADIAAVTAWIQGGLIFHDTPLRDVARELARTFNLEITVADATLAAQQVTGSYLDQPVDVILDDVTAVVGARYQRSGRTVAILPGSGRRSGTMTPDAGSRAPLRTALAHASGD